MSSTSANTEVPDTLTFYNEGGLLSKGKANTYIKLLETDPNNLEARLRLIGFYERQQGRKGVDLSSFKEHLGWLIRNHPEDSIHQWISLIPYRDEQYRALRRQ